MAFRELSVQDLMTKLATSEKENATLRRRLAAAEARAKASEAGAARAQERGHARARAAEELADITGLNQLREENARLRAENEALREDLWRLRTSTP